MTAPVKTVAIIGKYQGADLAQALQDIAAFVASTGRQVLFEADTAAHLHLTRFPCADYKQIGQQADLAIVLGGDGTMLGVGRQLAQYRVPLVGINQGRLGFMTDVPRAHMMSTLADMLDGRYSAEQRSLLEGEVVREDQVIFQGLAFNDVVVARGTGAGMVELRVDVDGHFMYNQRSDGLIVTTPTGSTAYALSAGGALLHPSLLGIGLVPIAPHALSNRPIVVPDSSHIVIEVRGGRDVSVNFDMQSLASLQHEDTISIRRSAHTLTFWHPPGWSYYDTLRKKLHWNEYPSVEGSLGPPES